MFVLLDGFFRLYNILRVWALLNTNDNDFSESNENEKIDLRKTELKYLPVKPAKMGKSQGKVVQVFTEEIA